MYGIIYLIIGLTSVNGCRRYMGIVMNSIEYGDVLLRYLIEDFVIRDNTSFGVHMDEFIGNKDTKTYLVEGFKIFEKLIKICRKNSWLNDFIPYFRLFLKDSDRVEKDPNRSLFRNVKCLITNMDKYAPPEICIRQRMSCWRISEGCDEHIYPLSNELLYKLFGFPNEIISKSLYVYYVRANNNNYCLDDVAISYSRNICISYIKNNVDVVRNLKRLPLRDKTTVDFFRKYESKQRD
jgi:hypothetical protein